MADVLSADGQQNSSGRKLWQPGQSGNPNGRQKGSKNKLTVEVKEMLLKALEREGGVDYFVRVAQEKPEVFCALIAKLIPSEVKADLTVTMPTLIVRNYTGRLLPEQEQGVVIDQQEAIDQ